MPSPGLGEDIGYKSMQYASQGSIKALGWGAGQCDEGTGEGTGSIRSIGKQALVISEGFLKIQ